MLFAVWYDLPAVDFVPVLALNIQYSMSDCCVDTALGKHVFHTYLDLRSPPSHMAFFEGSSDVTIHDGQFSSVSGSQYNYHVQGNLVMEQPRLGELGSNVLNQVR
jgi:hypothetical protein